MKCDVGTLDKIESLPSNCPIYWNSAEWLRVEDNINVTQTDGAVVDYQRHTRWIGAPHWDKNFYGPNAWTPTEYSNSSN